MPSPSPSTVSAARWADAWFEWSAQTVLACAIGTASSGRAAAAGAGAPKRATTTISARIITHQWIGAAGWILRRRAGRRGAPVTPTKTVGDWFGRIRPARVLPDQPRAIRVAVVVRVCHEPSPWG